VALLLDDPRVDPTVADNDAIVWASRFGHTKVINLLIKDGRTNPTCKDHTTLAWVCRNNHPAALEELLCDPRINPAINNNSAIGYVSFLLVFNLIFSLFEVDCRRHSISFGYHEYACSALD
jgi:ankyrin repeat protein